ncbi:AraC family transcriptional regulator [Uliginosibacterium sediminicola]|uniref:AraC family transcriptional regulator n=1 Tax=Uliginosibacterium sediminicola TaxID=2024550 RepID=A0ABU9Z403_9RHOO
MALTKAAFTSRRRSLARVLDYIGKHLDEELRLDDLVDLACLSRAYFLRFYTDKIGESPMASVRRLRLYRARDEVRAGKRSLLSIAADAGYGSNAAFTHAFVRTFGCAPSQLPDLAPAAPMPLRLEYLPSLQFLAAPYAGCKREAWQARAELDASLAVAGVRHWRVWHQLDRDQPFARHGDAQLDLKFLALPFEQLKHAPSAAARQNPLLSCFESPIARPLPGFPYMPARLAGLDHVQHAGGWHAVLSVRGSALPHSLPQLYARIENELGCRPGDGPIIRREVKVQGYTVAQEQHSELLVPVSR